MRASTVTKIILDLLSEQQAHLTSHQVYEKIRERLPAVNQSTVYRALERMAIAGQVSISDMGTGSAVYELVDSEIHHHLVCQKCGGMITLENLNVQDFFLKIQAKVNFKITTNHLILFGLCNNCQSEELNITDL